MSQLSDAEIADLREVVAKQKITEVLNRYCRGIDRCDLDTLLTVFWADAEADYGSGRQNAVDWSVAAVGALKGMHRTQHSVGNVLIHLEGERASAETYCHAYHEIDAAGGRGEMVVGGRYLDRLEHRDGEWRIVERIYVMDWNRNIPSTCNWDEGIYANLNNRGTRKPDDLLYRTPAFAGTKG